MIKTSIETINGKERTVVWYNEDARSICSQHKALWPIEWRIDGVGEWFASDGIHIATALPALPKHPKPEDAPLLYRYMVEGILVCGYDKRYDMRDSRCEPRVDLYYNTFTITGARDSKDGNKVEVAIKDA